MKKWLAVLLCVTTLASFCGCNKQEEATEPIPTETTVETTAAPTFSVGVCLPNQADARWLAEGAALTAALEAKNCEVKLLDAENNAQQQAEQMEKLAEEKVQCIVVAAADSAALNKSLVQIKNTGIPVIAYDRPLIHTHDFDGFVGVDYEKLGTETAQQIISAKALETAKAENGNIPSNF